MIHYSSALPAPDLLAIAHSEKLIASIQDEIDRQGAISFARYMELALYAPGLGYYSAGSHKFGKGGDFVTAPEISPLFSRCIARQCQQVLSVLKHGDILELGAGSGAMAVGILAELEQQHCLPEHYYILEPSADLKQRQQQLIQARLPHLYQRVIWLDTLESLKLRGIILANEVLDALPVHKFRITADGLQEFFITREQEKLVWQLGKPQQAVKIAIEQLQITLTENYESEINLLLPSWINSLQAILLQGLILLVDYGFPRHEYYHPDRDRGTLMCHYQHLAHDNPLIFPGLQDITAHVDFTAVAAAALAHDLIVAGYTAQAYFLLSCGITTMLEQLPDDDKIKLSAIQQIKQLTSPHEMGELFKVMALTRNFAVPLIGFSWYDMPAKVMPRTSVESY